MYVKNFTGGVGKIECKELWIKYSRTQGSIEVSLFLNCVQKPLGTNGAKEDLQLCAIFMLLYNCITLYLLTSDRWFYQWINARLWWSDCLPSKLLERSLQVSTVNNHKDNFTSFLIMVYMNSKLICRHTMIAVIHPLVSLLYTCTRWHEWSDYKFNLEVVRPHQVRETAFLVRNEQHCCSTAEWLQKVLQKSCKRAGCSSSKFWLFRAAVESPLTAINSAVAAVQKIPESRSALQSGCKVASKRQRMLLPVTAYHSLVQQKRNADFNDTISMKHGRGVDKALGGVKTTRKSKCNWYFISIHAYTLQKQVT